MQDAVLFEVLTTPSNKKIATMTLNKPKQLNALGIDMIDAMQTQLDIWKRDKDIAAVIIKAAGEKAFCAGGDIRAMYLAIKRGESALNEADRSLAYSFFRREYRLNFDLITCPIPIVVIGHGIVMGGGFGIFNGGTYRIVTEKSSLAMPEICIGLYPDVGASNFLNTLPGNIGRFLALTGSSVNGTDAVKLGLATDFIASGYLDELETALCDCHLTDDTGVNKHMITKVIAEFNQPSDRAKPQSIVNAHTAFIDSLFSEPDVHHVLDEFMATQTHDGWLCKAQANIEYGSPLSALIIDKQLTRSKNYTLKQVFESELALSCNVVSFSEFAEGVRALLIDKDMQPNWRYKHHREIPPSVVDEFFVSPWETNPLFTLPPTTPG